MSPSDKLGVFAPWRWLFDLSPGWAFVVMLFITPAVVKFILRPLWEGRILRGRDEFFAFNAELLFAPMLASGLVLVRAMDDRVYFAHDQTIHWIVLLCIGILSGLRINADRGVYTWRQMLSVTYIYRSLAFFYTIYVVVFAGVGLMYGPQRFELTVMRLMFLGCLILIIVAAFKDVDRVDEVDEDDQTLFWYAYVEDSYPWQHKYQYLGAWWRRYIAAWREPLERWRPTA